jgi:hypothetical protein
MWYHKTQFNSNRFKVRLKSNFAANETRHAFNIWFCTLNLATYECRDKNMVHSNKSHPG